MLFNEGIFNLDGLNEQSDELSDFLENWDVRQANLNVTQLSQRLRETYFKIQHIDRTQEGESEDLKNQYGKILENYNEMIQDGLTSPDEFNDLRIGLIKDLGNLKTKGGMSLNDVSIDGGYFEMARYMYEGCKKALNKVIEELKQTKDLILNPEEIVDIVNGLWEQLKSPVEFFENILGAIKEFGGDLYRDILAIKNSTTSKGYVIKLSEIIPEQGIPILISSVGPGKFLKILKLDKLIPAKLMDKIDGKKTTNTRATAMDKGMTDWLQMKKEFDLIDKHPNIAQEKIGKFVDFIDTDYLLDDIKRGLESSEIIKGFCDYIVKNGDEIQKLDNKKLQEFKQNFSRLRKKVKEISDNDNIEGITRKAYSDVNINDIDNAYYSLNLDKIAKPE